MPAPLKEVFAESNGGTVLVYNLAADDQFTAPSDGYLYFSFAGKTSAVDNGFLLESSIEVGGTEKLIKGNTISPYEGCFVVVVPVASGQTLVKEYLRTSVAFDWQSCVRAVFSPSALNMEQCAVGQPKAKIYTTTVANGATLTLEDFVNTTSAIAVKVQLLFNGGALGVCEWYVRGTGASATRTYQELINSAAAGLAVTAGYNMSTSMYYITVANTSGATVPVQVRVEAL
jgi:hypothetical protein